MPASEHSLTAWAGWSLRVPEGWQFFQVDGNYGRGLLVLGDDQRPRLELSWAWVTRRRFDAATYLQKFLRRRVPPAARPRLRPVRLPGFTAAALVEVEGRCIGAAFCQETSRLLHWIHHAEDQAGNAGFQKHLLPQWRDQTLENPIRWKFYDFDFTVPAGFRLESAELNLGSMEIVLNNPATWRARPRLAIRFIYPAALALARQPLEKWLGEISRAKRGPYRLTGKPQSLPGDDSGVLLRAALPFLLRTVLRPFVLRWPARMEASLHLVDDGQRLLYLQVADTPARIAETRRFLLGHLKSEAVS